MAGAKAATSAASKAAKDGARYSQTIASRGSFWKRCFDARCRNVDAEPECLQDRPELGDEHVHQPELEHDLERAVGAGAAADRQYPLDTRRPLEHDADTGAVGGG